MRNPGGLKMGLKWNAFRFGICIFVHALSANAQGINQLEVSNPFNQYFFVNSPKITLQEITEENAPENATTHTYANSHSQAAGLSRAALNSGGGGLAIADLALKVWQIIVDNRAVANVETLSTSALPKVVHQDWESMTGWKPERTVKFKLAVTNLLGMNVVEMDYSVRLLFGGSVGGKGLYIASAQVIPDKVNVLWGYNLEVTVNAAAVYNIGTVRSPVAAIDLDVNYHYGNPFGSASGSNRYLVRGDGLMKDQTNGKTYFPGSTHLVASH